MKATHSMTDATDGNSEEAAAKLLGHTQVSWDNVSGNEQQPWSDEKSWDDLSAAEKSAVLDLGYTAKTWDNASGQEKQPASAKKYWSDLTTSGGYCISSLHHVIFAAGP